MEGIPANVIYFNDEQEEKERTNVVDLRVITGGKEPPKNTGNWLKDLEDGTVFFVQNKIDLRDFNLALFRLNGKAGINDKVVCLMSPHLPKEIYVDPHRFCNQYNLHHVEGVIDIPIKEQENDNNRISTPPGETPETVA